MPAGVGYSPQQLEALSMTTGFDPETLAQLLDRGGSPRGLLSQAHQISEADVAPHFAGMREEFQQAGFEPGVENLRVLESLLQEQPQRRQAQPEPEGEANFLQRIMRLAPLLEAL